MLEITEVLTAEEKQSAVAHVLTSRTLARCDQLKQFLRYVAEQEISGQGESITEYSIGVKALGRSEDFLPTEDSSVRTRAHALRKKLEEFYREEAPDELVRIQLPKGSYSPRFVRVDPPLESVSPVVPVRIIDLPGESTRGRANGQLIRPAITFLLGLLVAAGGMLLLRHPLAKAAVRSEIPAMLREAWGPLLEPDAAAMLVIATPPQLFLRDYADQARPLDPVWAPDLPQDKDLLKWYGLWQPVTSHSKLLLHPNSNSPLWGDAAAAIEATATLSRYEVSNTLVRERLLKPYVLRDRNVMLFGRAEYSEAIRIKMNGLPFQIEYSSERRTFLIANRRPKHGEPAFYEPGAGGDNDRDVYGLITVLPSDSAGETGKRTVVFSGLTSGGTQAAYEFFGSPESLADLKSRFQRDGMRSLPSSYQVVVKVNTDQTLPLRFRYQNHRVF